MYKIIARAAVGGSAALALAVFGLLSAAGAGASQVATHYSMSLAGHAMQGNGSQAFEAVWGGATVPNPGAVPADSVASGIVMAASPVNPGLTYGLGLVWDDTVHSNTCGAGQWTLEAGSEVTSGIPGPVVTGMLEPLSEFGSPVCVAPGGYLWMKMQQSTSHHLLSYIAGPSEHNNDVIDQVPAHVHFLATGEGVTTTSLTATNDLTDGVQFSFDTWAVTDLASHKAGAHAANRNALAFNYATYVGTQDGVAPTPANPVILQPSAFTKVGFGSANTITVP
jgi:hypothetical protein